MQWLIELLNNFVLLFIESAPWLLLGLLMAGMMKWLLPVNLLEKHMGTSSAGSVIKAAIIGAPLPLCSCGVIPAAIGLRRAGASKPATVSFLVATPETGVDSISVSYALLGPVMAIVRPIAAISSAIYAGLVVRISTTQAQTEPVKSTPSEAVSCCSSAKTEAKPVSSCCSSSNEQTSSQNKSSCCASEKPQVPAPAKSCCGSASKKPAEPNWQQKVINTLQFSSGKLLNDISKWLLIGLTLAAMVKTFVPVDFLTQWGDGFIAMLVMALIGIPMYICATASTPIALGFLAAGVSPGAVLVFLLAGPATNISTMGMIYQEMGKRTLMAYLFSIMTASIGFGYALNALIDVYGWPIGNAALMSHEHSPSLLYIGSAVLLAGLMLRNLLQHLKSHQHNPAAAS
ncbi:SO_0444 family Cu/Zn efflux transporter [Neptunicella marina]|uniref:SO_0444 family Cu/Zn efflux transporter n=1 Tax=Neptunicella marina TaxID=2125989 RepID=A0A8J6IUN5_9ALTE|nr:SO_0444 family Cu/Zn efflux transporter [Neptunicella marina]MBC3765956.1 SO_0444 family Cu/Zn efflux transporter [Neptunicella marina]